MCYQEPVVSLHTSDVLLLTQIEYMQGGGYLYIGLHPHITDDYRVTGVQISES